MTKKIAILISGGGTNLQAFIDAVEKQQLVAEISVVISNRPDVKGLTRANDAGIPTELIDHTHFDNRESFDQQLAQCIDSYQVDLIVLAGFMRILGKDFVQHFYGKLVNIHPSLLPKYTGLNTHQRAIDDSETMAGVTVHFVVPELDAGPAIIQASVPVLQNDSADKLAQRVLKKEHIIYPLAVNWFCQNKLHLSDDGVMLDGQLLTATGYQLNEHPQNKL